MLELIVVIVVALVIFNNLESILTILLVLCGFGAVILLFVGGALVASM